MRYPDINSDNPIHRPPYPCKDLAGYSEHLASFIEALPFTPPILISGDWGAGKTTLLWALEGHFKKQDKVATVWFDAWRYEREVGLLPALVRAVWRSIPHEMRERENLKNIVNNVWKGVAALGLRTLPWFTAIPDTNPWPNPPLPEIRTLRPQNDATEMLRKQFHDMVQEAWPSRKLVILVDDLDRCSPDGAMALLDGIRMLLPVAEDARFRCQFVVALDRKILTSAVSQKYAGISGFDGNRYLEKLFPITLQLPVPSSTDIRDLVEECLKDQNITERPNATERGDLSALLQALDNPLFANPRLIKRCVNRYRLVTHFEDSFSTPLLKPGSQPAQALARWIVAIERWPALRRLLPRYTDKFWHDIADGDDMPTLPDEVLMLLQQEDYRLWLQQEVGREEPFSPYRDAERVLQRWGL